MSGFFLSERSLNRLVGVDPRWPEILQLAIKLSKVDFGIPADGGLRTAERQNYLFHSEVSKADGYDKISKHQLGLAVDVYAYVAGKASWEPDHLAMVNVAILQAASVLGHKISSGILWSTGKTQNGIDYGWDAGHLELLE